MTSSAAATPLPDPQESPVLARLQAGLMPSNLDSYRGHWSQLVTMFRRNGDN